MLLRLFNQSRLSLFTLIHWHFYAKDTIPAVGGLRAVLGFKLYLLITGSKP